MTDTAKKVAAAFFESAPSNIEPYGNGHINSTFLVTFEDDCRYILQKVNSHVFPRPHEVMKNILAVTEHIRAKLCAEGKDANRGTLKVVSTLAGKPYFDADGECWRVYEFIENTVAPEKVECAQDFYNCAYAFGVFQQQLADYPAEKLYETITNFHNTPVRYQNLMRAIENDPCGRVAKVSAEIEFARARKEFCETLVSAHAAGELPLRVTHNDTKLNNILFDSESGEAVAVIDLDTVMPGFSVTDFGDSIRFGANTAAEDETDLSKVSLDLELFKTYAEGFLKGCNGSLTKKEIELLPAGAMMMTLECGMRFLTDYIEGDVYFKIHRPEHNLDRCRSQFALVADMERKLDQINAIIADILK